MTRTSNIFTSLSLTLVASSLGGGRAARRRLFFGLPVLALLALANGCTYYTMTQNPTINEERLEKAPPSSLAVMPVRNETNKKGLDAMMRRNLYSQLSTLNYRDVELENVNQTVAERSMQLDLAPKDVPPKSFQKAKFADALLYADIVKTSKFWFLIYSHVSLGVDLTMFDTSDMATLYRNHAVLHKRRFSVPTSIGGFVEAFVTNLWHLRDSELEVVTREFGRRIVEEFPDPMHSTSRRMGIDEIMVSGPDDELEVGDLLKVEVIGTPGQKATFDLGASITARQMTEMSPGVYYGAYQVQPGDLWESGVVQAHLRSDSGATTTLRDTESAYRIDTLPPPQPKIARYMFGKNCVTLEISLPRPEPGAVFEVYRSTPDKPSYEFRARVDAPRWSDRHIRPNTTYSYLVKTLDKDGNVSQTSKPLDVPVPAKGPVRLPGVMKGKVRLHLYSSPYVVDRNCMLAPGSELQVEPGVEIKVSSGGRLIMLGDARFVGTVRDPIRITGEPNTTLLCFEPEKKTDLLRMDFVEVRNGVVGLEARGGRMMISRCDFQGMSSAILAKDVDVMQLWRCDFKNVNLALGGSLDVTEVKYCQFHDLPKAINAWMKQPTFEDNDFYGDGMAISQLAPQTVPVDDNFFDSINPVELLERLQGPCVFRRIYQKPSSEKSRVTLFPGEYQTYREMGDRFYEQNAWDSTLRSYLRAWWMHKEREVGNRLIEILQRGRGFGGILQQDKQFGELTRRSRRLRAAMHVAHTLAVMYPEDREILGKYAELLKANGFGQRARDVRDGLQPGAGPSLSKSDGGRPNDATRSASETSTP